MVGFERLDHAVHLVHDASEQARDDRVLGREVDVEGAARDPGLAEDLLDIELVRRDRRQQTLGGVEDRALDVAAHRNRFIAARAASWPGTPQMPALG